MAINKDGNAYTFFFASGMVLIVGALLAFLFLSWKPKFDENDAVKKKMDVLAAINVENIDRANANELFDKYISEIKVLNYDGSVDESADGLKIDVKKSY
ncbi:MAG: NADH:ubiquinone reductase (Na(+)-transporting) subunit C, partial [Saprospiraceae bacterium]|nr:NADH:ubiquinone reductase (Na(+)-transporting) subunit C [Saprospiraceae bacterium]